MNTTWTDADEKKLYQNKILIEVRKPPRGYAYSHPGPKECLDQLLDCHRSTWKRRQSGYMIASG